MTVTSVLDLSLFVGSFGNHNIAIVTEYYVLHKYTYTNSEHNYI